MRQPGHQLSVERLVLDAGVPVRAEVVTEQQVVLFISLDPPPPATVTDPGLDVIGVVFRSPPDPSAVFTVTAITTSPGAVDTSIVQAGSAGSFTVRIPIARDTIGIINDVVVVATEDIEDVISQPVAFTIIGLGTD